MCETSFHAPKRNNRTRYSTNPNLTPSRRGIAVPVRTGTVTAVLDEVAIDSSRKGVLMLEVCDKCGSSVSKRLLRCSDQTAVFHRECVNGHKLHKTTGKEDQQTADSHATTSYVMIEACDCH